MFEIKILESTAFYFKKTEDLADGLRKSMFVATDGCFSRWLKRENIHYLKPHGEQGDADNSAAEYEIVT